MCKVLKCRFRPPSGLLLCAPGYHHWPALVPDYDKWTRYWTPWPLEICRRHLLIGKMPEKFEELSHRNHGRYSQWWVNAKLSNIKTISFLKSTPSFKQPIPPEMSIQQCKLLGITISSDLKWEVHVTNITKQANLALSTLKFFFKFSCPAFYLLRIYKSLIHPVLEYSYPVWHFGLTTSQSYSIESVHGKLLYHFLLKQF